MAMTVEEQKKLERSLVERGKTDLAALDDGFELARLLDDHESGNEIRKLAMEHLRKGGGADATMLYHRSLIFDGPVNFDCFMRALEFNRPVNEQFWLPRRKKLMPVCQALQDMEEDKLDELFLSCPPRIGKSTLMMMFFLWVMGRNSERSNLYCSYTDSVVGVLYNGILEVLNDSYTYAFGDIFQTKVASTNAKDLLINLERKKRYASFTGRSLYGTLNGACDCNGYLVGDDLISGIEEARSKDRLESAWSKVDNNMLPRAKETAKILWIGTRWSLFDPQGKRVDLLENDAKYANRRWKVLNTPALNGDDESNFEYDYGVGFSTDYYIQRRASFERNGDTASWLAQYQGEPIERDGAVFDPSEMRYFNGVLPDTVPDRIFLVCDPAWGGNDYVAALIVCQYDYDLYVPDVIYSNADKTVTQPMIVGAIKKHNVSAVKIEGTKMTASYGEDIDKKLREEGIRVNLTINTTHFASVKNKQDRIIAAAPDIRSQLIFLQEGCRQKHYSQFMQSLYSTTYNGKGQKHDDAADACAMTIDFVTRGVMAKAEIMRRPW